jgi:hypothetical protein
VRRLIGTQIVVMVLAIARSASAVDPFEIQVYDGTANTPGTFGLELHLNYVAKGIGASAPPELPMNHQGHATLEPSIGLFPWWELGGYLQSAVRADGTYDYAGFKLRSKFVTTEGFDPRWRLGANFEMSLMPDKYDRDQLGTEVRPIVAWENERWLFAVNPIVDLSLRGDGWRAGPSFEPAAKASYKWDGQLGVGFEYYANLGAFGDGFAALRDQEHYVYEVIDLLTIEGFELNAGLGEGLTAGSQSIVAKLIVGYEFGGRSTPRATNSMARHPMRVIR